MIVTDPTGTQWRVFRVWGLRRPRWRFVPGGGLFTRIARVFAELGDIEAVLVALALFLATVGLFALGLPLVVFAVELVVLLVVFGAGLFARVVLRQPWTVLARPRGAGPELRAQAVGWRGSAEAMADLARRIQAGDTSPLGAQRTY